MSTPPPNCLRRNSGAGRPGDRRSRCRRADRPRRRISPDVQRLPSVPLSYAPCENIGMMIRIYLLLVLAAPFLCGARDAVAAARDSGNLTFDNIPEPPAGMSEKLDAYLNARQATPLGFSPKGQLLIVTRFGDADQLHLVERPAGERRQITFL